MKIGINLQDDRISYEVIHESMNSVSYEKFYFWVWSYFGMRIELDLFFVPERIRICPLMMWKFPSDTIHK